MILFVILKEPLSSNPLKNILRNETSLCVCVSIKLNYFHPNCGVGSYAAREMAVGFRGVAGSVLRAVDWEPRGNGLCVL